MLAQQVVSLPSGQQTYVMDVPAGQTPAYIRLFVNRPAAECGTVAVLDPHAALSGVAIVTGQLGPGVGTAAIVAEWHEHKVQQVSLEKGPSGYQGKVAPFVSGIDRPVAVSLAPDGSVMLGDWATGTVNRVAAKGSPGTTTASR